MEILDQRVEQEVKDKLIEKGIFYQNPEEIMEEFIKNDSIFQFQENVEKKVKDDKIKWKEN
jgi:hypothetical protein